MSLVERETDLAQLEALTLEVQAGHGAVALVEGPAGIGKTSLLATLCPSEGLRVLTARAAPGEGDFAHGVTRALYEPAARDHLARALQGGERFAIRHALYWLAVDLAAERPLLLVVDDAQWADAPSLEALLHLAARISDSGCGLLLARRTGEPGAEQLDELASQPATMLIQPRPLSTDGVATLVGDRASGNLAARLHELTGGNPLLVREAMRELGDSFDQGALDRLASARLGHAVLLRLGRLAPSAPALARALTVLGDGAPLRHAAALAKLDLASAARAADALRAAEVLAPSIELAFLHPLLRAAIEQAEPMGARARAHARAAALLHAESAADELIAAHLLHAEPAAADWAVGHLSTAADLALERGAPELAARLLERALAEPAAELERPRLLARHLESLALTGDYLSAVKQATALLDDATYAPRAAPVLAGARIINDDITGAVDIFQRAINAARPADRSGLEAQLGLTGMLSPQTAAPALKRLAAAAATATPDTAGGRALLGAYAFALMVIGEDRTAAVQAARRALRAGLLDDDPFAGVGYQAVLALDAAEAFREARELMDRTIAALPAHHVYALTWAHQQRASIAVRTGELATAEADAQLALRFACMGERDGVLAMPAALAFLIDVLVEQGRLTEADELLEERRIGAELPRIGPWQWLHFSRARLRLRQRRPQEALTALEGIGAYRAAGGFEPPLNPWRALAAEAALQLGHRERARELARADLAAAKRWGGGRRVGIALQACALTDDDPVATLRQAIIVLEPTGAQLELARAEAALGATLRRAGERRAAREHLRTSLDTARRCGATALAEHAREQLALSGARLRREALSGPAALTPAERRVAELAAAGLTNRQIAEQLWVSRKTIEAQLGAVYQKLGTSDRTALAPLLQTHASGDDPDRG